MDEIDAALDFRNVSIVANYIKDRTKNAQFIIISLRYARLVSPDHRYWQTTQRAPETTCSNSRIDSLGYTRPPMLRRVCSLARLLFIPCSFPLRQVYPSTTMHWSHSRTQRRSCLRILYYFSSYCGLGFTIISNLDRQTVLLSCTCICKVMNWLPHWRQELVADKTITKPSTFVQFVIKVVGVVIIDLCSKSYKYFKFVWAT